jgi:hypothetical protein
MILLLAIVGVLLNIGYEKFGAGVPDWLYFLFWLVPLFMVLYVGWTDKRVKKFHPVIYTYPRMSLAIMIVVGAVIGGVIGALFWWGVSRQLVTAAQSAPIRPTLEEVSQPEVKAEEGKPNIIVVGYNKPPVIYDPVARIFKEAFADQGALTLVAYFRNAHEHGKELSEATDMRAHIGYEPFEFYEKLGKGIKNAQESTSGWQSVDDGVWLGETQPLVKFARGETKALILAAQGKDGTFFTYSHPIEQNVGITVPFPRVRILTADKYIVKVQITGGSKGEIAELYHFTITLRPEFAILRG